MSKSSPLILSVSFIRPTLGWIIAGVIYGFTILQQVSIEQLVQSASQGGNSLRGTAADMTPAAAGPEFAFMIPSTHRFNDAFYLNQTVSALLAAEIPATDITILNGDSPGAHHLLEAYVEELNASQQRSVHVIQRRENISSIEDLRNIRGLPFDVHPVELQDERTKLDKEERVLWRAKEALDFHYLVEETMQKNPNTDWFVFVQDDAILIKESPSAPFGSLIPRLRRMVKKRLLNRDTDVAYFSLVIDGQGAVALMFHRAFLDSLLPYVKMRFDVLPIDWLIEKHAQLLGVRSKIYPIFAHIGRSSTLDGKLSDFVHSSYGKVLH